MTVPNYPDKHDSTPVFSPLDLREYRKYASNDPGLNPPKNIILCYSRALVEYIKSNYEVTQEKFPQGELYSFNNTSGSVGIIGNFGFGSPVVVTLTEVLISLGAKRFLNIGIAGTLQKHVGIGDVVVCDKAIRDEGTSYHYIEPSMYAYPTEKITGDLIQVLKKKELDYVIGSSWTTDAPYRETVAEVLKYQKEGVLTVEMEASALFALAEHRNVEMGAIFTISDSLAELEWKPEFHSDKTNKGLENILKVSLEALSE